MADPVGKTNQATAARISTQRFLIAGLNVTVHGLGELRGTAKNVACLWVHHPRLLDAHSMTPVTATIVSAWNSSPNAARLGLIGVTIDQRNHGSRLQKHIYNTAWRDGNESHAPDMFSAFQGTMLDTRQLIEYLPGYVFPNDERKIVDHLAFGISLGGHAVWHLLMHEPRIRTGVVVIGGPDYALFMKDRARLSRRRSYTRGQGERFFGSPDFPTALVEALKRWDPAGIFLGGPAERDDLMHPRDPASEEERARIAALIRHHLGNKRIQCLSGAQDRLVPPPLAVPFMDWLKRAIGAGNRPGVVSGGSTTSSSSNPEWKAGAGRGWMVADDSSTSNGNGNTDSGNKVPERWKGPDWKQGAGSGWMVSSRSTSTSASTSTPTSSEGSVRAMGRWKGPDWRAGAGAGWMTGTATATATGKGGEGGAAGAGDGATSSIGPGWAGDTGIVLEDIHFDGVGHEMTPHMLAEATRFITRALDEWVGDRGARGERGERAKL